MATTKINMTILSAVFACAILIGAVSVIDTQAFGAETYPHDHDTADVDDAKDACDGEDSCVDCIDQREALQGLKNYEVDNCLNDQY
jgi:hypothetical protein